MKLDVFLLRFSRPFKDTAQGVSLLSISGSTSIVEGRFRKRYGKNEVEFTLFVHLHARLVES